MFAARRLHLGDIILEEEPVLVGKGRAESMEWAGAMEQEFRKLDPVIQVSCWHDLPPNVKYVVRGVRTMLSTVLCNSKVMGAERGRYRLIR
jgi:hypothetical protein